MSLGAYSVGRPLGHQIGIIVSFGSFCLRRQYGGNVSLANNVWEVGSGLNTVFTRTMWGAVKGNTDIPTEGIVFPEAENDPQGALAFIEEVRNRSRGLFDPRFTELLGKPLTMDDVLAHHFECGDLVKACGMGFVSKSPGEAFAQAVARILSPAGSSRPTGLLERRHPSID